MMKYYIFIFLAFTCLTNKKDRNLYKQSFVYVESSLKHDVYFFGGFEKEDIREPSFFIVPIPIGSSKEIKVLKEISDAKSTSIYEANYILFYSQVDNNKLTASVLHNRPIHDDCCDNFYERISEFNTEYIYTFQFDKRGHIEKISKSWKSYN